MSSVPLMSVPSTSRYTILDRPGFRFGALMGRWESLLVLLLIAVFAINGALLPHFLDPDNLADGTFNFSEKALIALPMALLIICREIDISVAGILALSSVAMGLANTAGWPPESLLFVGVGTGVVCGALNGVLVTDYDGVSPVPPKKGQYEPDRGPRPDTGYIAIQHHGGNATVWFKEITLVK